jgi:predicted lipoprotein with Yx(FWY)xxD motif
MSHVSNSPTRRVAARRALATAAVLAVAVVALAACSSGYAQTPPPSTTQSPAPTTVAPSPATSAPAPATGAPAPAVANPAIQVGKTTLGPLVADATNHTLYRFDKDTPGSGTSACTGACAAAWPPALITGQPAAGPGVPGVLGAITRPDGTRQVTLDGHPLYRFAGDGAPGDANGDGTGGIWHVVHAAA